MTDIISEYVKYRMQRIDFGLVIDMKIRESIVLAILTISRLIKFNEMFYSIRG